MSALWEDGPTDPTEKLVLLAIADHANDEGMAYPSMAGIAAKCSLTERGARGIIRRLEASNWLLTKVGGGRGGKSVYHVLTAENRNEKPGMTNPECETRNVTTVNPERDDNKPGTSVPPNHQGTIKEPSNSNDARVCDILCEVAGRKAAESFVAYRRKSKHKAMTVTAAERLAKKLHKLSQQGYDPDDALGMAEESGWASVEIEWYLNRKGPAHGQSPRTANQTRGQHGGGYGQRTSIASVIAQDRASGRG